MKIPEAPRTKKAEGTFSALFVIFLLLILPYLPLGKYGGGIALVVVSLIGLLAYVILFRERHDWRRIIVAACLAGVVGAAVVMLNRGHWH
jgi:drug/metabolite transporter (DMT)-like permease